MCGRFTVKATWAELVALYRLTMDAPPHNLRSRYNVCPTDPVDTVIAQDGIRKSRGSTQTQARESSDSPILNAFCRVAPSVRLSALVIREAFFFWRAIVFKVRTWSAVHARRLVAFLAIR